MHQSVSSIEEVRARLIQLAQNVPIDPLNEANYRLIEITGKMRQLAAGTTNSELEQALGRLERTNSEAIDTVEQMIEARDGVWRAAEAL
jgi:hypothetical protein